MYLEMSSEVKSSQVTAAEEASHSSHCVNGSEGDVITDETYEARDDGVFIQWSLSFVSKLCIFSWRTTNLRIGNSLICPGTCFPNLSYWSSRYRFCDIFCNFEIADSTATILSGSRLFLGGGFLSGETFFSRLACHSPLWRISNFLLKIGAIAWLDLFHDVIN